MSIIDEAERRLEVLKQAGILLPEESATVSPIPMTGPASDIQKDVAGGIVGSMAAGVIGVKADVSQDGDDARQELGGRSSHHHQIHFPDSVVGNFITPETLQTRLADEYRVIKRPLLINARGRGERQIDKGNLIMVTSALPGEGKSFTAINLAMSIAMEMDNTVLLVDADVAHPSVLRYLGIPSSKGLLDMMLEEDVDMGDVLIHTNIEKLSILAGGSAYKHATELLASDAMDKLISEIGSRYSDRIVIFDSPPLLVTTESRVLASHMGQILMVVEAGRTPHAAVKQAVATIENCPSVMMLLNKGKANHAGSYGYGYGYGYGYYRNGRYGKEHH